MPLVQVIETIWSPQLTMPSPNWPGGIGTDWSDPAVGEIDPADRRLADLAGALVERAVEVEQALGVGARIVRIGGDDPGVVDRRPGCRGRPVGGRGLSRGGAAGGEQKGGEEEARHRHGTFIVISS